MTMKRNMLQEASHGWQTSAYVLMLTFADSPVGAAESSDRF